MQRPNDPFGLLKRLAEDRLGNMAFAFAVSSAAVIASAGGAIDYLNVQGLQSRYQTAADAAAIAAAREFRLGNPAVATIEDVVERYASTNLEDLTDDYVVNPKVDTRNRTVTVNINGKVPTYFMHIFGTEEVEIGASATAKVVGGTPICVIGLDAKAAFTVAMDVRARLLAPNCAIYSNSRAANGLMAKNRAKLEAEFICSAGGKQGAGPGSFVPEPQTDCPVVPDPLAERPGPKVGGCDHKNLVVNGGTATLAPGTYCGGIVAQAGAMIRLEPGIYVLKDGPLSVDGEAELEGENVSLHFTGNGAVIDFRPASSISLTAPARGPLAGILLSEDRGTPEKQVHDISSNDARMLLGTIYLPRNRLHVAAEAPVADKSAYTIVVARMFTLSEGPTMVLNTNYSATDIPVPDGVGPAKAAMLVD